MQVDDDFNVSDPADLERKFETVKNDFQRRMLAIEQHFKVILSPNIYHTLYLIQLMKQFRIFFVTQPSSGSDHEPKDKKTVD